jgi:hypothetical protein
MRDRDWTPGTCLGSGLCLGPDGDPGTPLITVDLDKAAGWRDGEIEAAARVLGDELAVTAGIGHSAPSARLRPLARALTLSLVPEGDADTAYVAVPDVDAALVTLRTAVRAAPQAAVALAGLVRVTCACGVRPGLLAEAGVYSTLLGGREFRRWLATRDNSARAGSDQPAAQAERHGDLLTVTLNRPQRRNAMNAAMREALVDALTVPLADTSITTIELRGAGPCFCSGGDLDEFGLATDLAAAFLVRLDRSPWWLLHRLRDRARARVHGSCIGAGLEMAAFAGSVVATPDASFRLPEVSMGLVPGAGGTVSVVRRIGRWRAAWMMLTGTLVPASTALCWGLIDTLEES